MAFEEERSFSELLQDAVKNVEHIIRAEILLAKTELREEARGVMLAGRALVAGAALGLYALGFLLLCCVYALAMVIPSWAAALVVGGTLAIIAAVLMKGGLQLLKRVKAPEQTIESIKENVQWAKNQAK